MVWPLQVLALAVAHGHAEEGGRLMAWIMVAIGVILLGLLVAQLVYRYRDRHQRTATYHLVRSGEDGLAIRATQPDAPEVEGLQPGPSGLAGLMAAASQRVDIRVHEVAPSSGGTVPFEDYDPEVHGPAWRLLLEDSRGLIELTAEGSLVARPPLDEPVRADLEELLGEAMARAVEQ